MSCEENDFRKGNITTIPINKKQQKRIKLLQL